MSGPDTHKWWYGWRARLYALTHRNPASNLVVVHWVQLEPDMRVLDIGCGTGAAVNAAAPDLANSLVLTVAGERSNALAIGSGDSPASHRSHNSFRSHSDNRSIVHLHRDKSRRK
jgi:precorrin-6B methylase 2